MYIAKYRIKMSKKDNNQVNPLTSEQFTGLKLRKPPEKAAGIPAVITALKHSSDEMGFLKASKTLLKLNKADGFDCPGCAWPDPEPNKRSSVAEYCENGAKAVAEEGTKKKVDHHFFEKYSVADLSKWSDYEIGKSGRIIEPMILREGKTNYEPISWSDAFDTIGKELKSLDSPDEAIFYTSGRTSNEAAFSYQLFVRAFGTNNLPDCSNMCHESSGSALSEVLGIGKGSVTLEDFYKSELILVVGQNPGTNHPRMLSALTKAKKNGANIVSINPLKETGLKKFVNPQEPLEILKGGTSLSDHFLQVKINEDVSLFKAMMKLLLEADKKEPGSFIDHDFIKRETQGYEAFVEDLQQFEIDDLIKKSGVSRKEIEDVVELIKNKKRIIICWAMGLTQHKNAVHTIREVVNLLLLKGSIGIEGGGTCPVRGHSNVQGDRTVGIWEKPPQFLKDGIKKRFGVGVPERNGYDVVDSIKAMKEKKAKFFMAMGGNFLSATPDTNLTAEALQQCDMTVHVSTKLNRSHLVHGKTSIILPCKARSEKDIHDGNEHFVSVENSTGLVHRSVGLNTPPSNDLLSETQIVCRLGKATLDGDHINFDEMEKDYDVIRDHIEAVIPGFDQYNERVRKSGGFYLPNGSREGKWNNKEGKALFTINEPADHTLAADELMMMTIRSHDQYNTTIYGLDDKYRGIYNERRVVLVSEKDMEKFDLNKEEVVDLSSTYDGEIRIAPKFIVVPYDIPEGCIATYFPEANVLVPIQCVADRSNTPASKSIKVRVVKRSTAD